MPVSNRYWIGAVGAAFLVAAGAWSGLAADPRELPWPRSADTWTGAPRFVTLAQPDGSVDCDGASPASHYVAWLALDRVVEAAHGYDGPAEAARRARRLREHRKLLDDVGLALAYAVSYGLSARSTSRILREIHGISA